jgi:hypothetical protein
MPTRNHKPFSGPRFRTEPEPQISRPVPTLLTVANAWSLFNRRTGGRVSRTWFYRAINDGRMNAYRFGFRFMIPAPEIERVIALCLAGERI